MKCQSCGEEIPQGVKFCAKCGAAVEDNVRQNTYNQPPAYAPQPAPMSVGGWMGRSLIPCIPFVGWLIYIIMLFVWSGDTTKELSFRNWAKAQLVWMLIGIILSIIAVVIIAALGGLTYFAEYANI